GDQREGGPRHPGAGRRRVADAEDRHRPDRRRQAGRRTEQVTGYRLAATRSGARAEPAPLRVAAKQQERNPRMTSLKLLRCAAAVALVGGLFLALPGCNKPPAENKDDKKDKTEQPAEPKGGNTGDTKSGSTGSGSPVLPVQPAKVDITSGVGKEAVDFLQAVKAGTAKADQLSATFTRLIGLPAELPSDKAKGYSTDAAADWLRHVGSGVGFG